MDIYIYIKYIYSFILILKDLEIEECIEWVDILGKGPRFLVDEEVFLRVKAGMVRTLSMGNLKELTGVGKSNYTRVSFTHCLLNTNYTPFTPCICEYVEGSSNTAWRRQALEHPYMPTGHRDEHT